MHAPDDFPRGVQPLDRRLPRLRRAALVQHDAASPVHAHAAHRVVDDGRDAAGVERPAEIRVEGRVGEVRLVRERVPEGGLAAGASVASRRLRGALRLGGGAVVGVERVPERRLQRSPPAPFPRVRVRHLHPPQVFLHPRGDTREGVELPEQALVDVQRHVLIRLLRRLGVHEQHEVEARALPDLEPARLRLAPRLREHPAGEVVPRAQLVREPAAVARQKQSPRAAQNLRRQRLGRRRRVAGVDEPRRVDLHVREVHALGAQPERHLVPVARRAPGVRGREANRLGGVLTQQRRRALAVVREPARGQNHGARRERLRVPRLRARHPDAADGARLLVHQNLLRLGLLHHREVARRLVRVARLLHRQHERRPGHAARGAVRPRVRVPAQPPHAR